MLDLGECKVSIVCMSHCYQPFVSGHRYGKFKHAGRLAPFFYKCWPVRRSKCACRPAVVLKCAGRLALHRLAPILSWSSVWDHAGRLALPPVCATRPFGRNVGAGLRQFSNLRPGLHSKLATPLHVRTGLRSISCAPACVRRLSPNIRQYWAKAVRTRRA